MAKTGWTSSNLPTVYFHLLKCLKSHFENNVELSLVTKTETEQKLKLSWDSISSKLEKFLSEIPDVS